MDRTRWRRLHAIGDDFRRANGGAYGRGAYFASAAAYPVRIFPKRQNGDGTFTLIVAEVALATVFWPPPREQNRIPGVPKLNSVDCRAET